MIFLLKLGVYAALILSCSAAIANDKGVLVLTDDNFDEAVAENTNLLVEFYAPWCGHCKKLTPEYEAAAAQLAEFDVNLAKVDATEQKVLAKKFEIKGFPTLKFFKGGKDQEYGGGRTADTIVSWLKKKIGPAFVTVSTESELQAIQDANEAFVLGVFDSLESDNAKAFVGTASGDDNAVYAATTADAVKAKLGVSGEALVVLKSFDNLRDDFSLQSGYVAADVETFVMGATTPLIQEFSDETSKKIFGSGITKHILIFTEKAADHHTTTIDAYKAVAPDFKGQMLFVSVPSSQSRVTEYFGITEYPAMIIGDMSSGGVKKFPFAGPHESSAIKEHITNFVDGKLKPVLKSEPVEADDQTGSVVVLRGTSFDDIVINNDKDVLVEFYAPWCGHCKKLAPIYDELGDKYSKNTNVVIAKMDMTANEIDVPGVDVKGFPTLFFFKGNDKTNPMSYDSGRDLESFVKFLDQNTHNPTTVLEEL